jgi:hypothetical protein
MNRRGANEDIKNLYGGGIEELLSQQVRDENEPSLPTEMESDYPVMALKRKKQAAILKDILKQGGYGDLARQVSIRRPA